MKHHQLIIESTLIISLEYLTMGNIKNNFKMKRVTKIMINQNLNLRF